MLQLIFDTVSSKMHLMEFRGALEVFSKFSLTSSSLLSKICFQNPSKNSQWKKNVI